MNRLRWTHPAAVLWLACLCAYRTGIAQDAAPEQARFATVDIYVNSGKQPLAAYQLEWSAGAGAKIAGIEGGEHVAFQEPPFYDPKAIQRERVILAAFSTAAKGKLPTGRTRVATIHVLIGDADSLAPLLKNVRGATAGGAKIKISASSVERNVE